MRLIKAAFVALGVVVVLALPAAAQNYPPDTGVVGGERTAAAGAVQQPSGADGDALASTGSPVTVGTAVGGGLLVAGAAAVVAARRRGRATV